jgi:hypothetical protein
MKCVRERGRITEKKTEADWGYQRLAQVLVKPQVFSIHMD